MPYTALPDRRMPYDNDGTIVGYRTSNSTTYLPTDGFSTYLTGASLIDFNDDDRDVVLNVGSGGNANKTTNLWYFFPEQREVTGMVIVYEYTSYGALAFSGMQGSNDSTNGVDGTWETASFPGGNPHTAWTLDAWRASIKPVSFTGAKQVIRWYCSTVFNTGWLVILNHIYGEKAAGQTPDDIIYINHDDTPGTEYTIPEDFGDQPLGTTVVRQFRLKNVSPTKTANTINIQCNDSDFAISEDGVNWVVTINITSLSAGAESATLYVRCTTPAPGGQLGPRFARIVTTVASYT